MPGKCRWHQKHGTFVDAEVIEDYSLPETVAKNVPKGKVIRDPMTIKFKNKDLVVPAHQVYAYVRDPRPEDERNAAKVAKYSNVPQMHTTKEPDPNAGASNTDAGAGGGGGNA